MARFVHRFVHHWQENSFSKNLLLVLSPTVFLTVSTYVQVIEDYFANIEMEAEMDNECS